MLHFSRTFLALQGVSGEMNSLSKVFRICNSIHRFISPFPEDHKRNRSQESTTTPDFNIALGYSHGESERLCAF